MKYFENFPIIPYILDENNTNVNLVTNIFARNAFLRKIKDNIDISYAYSIKDSDTPEIIADKEYGDPYKSWVILLFNNIINPNYDWPLKQDSLNDYIQTKYNQTIDQATLTINHYEKVITKSQFVGGNLIDKTVQNTITGEFDVDYSTNKLTPAVLPVVPDTSSLVSDITIKYPDYTINIVTEIKAVSNYQTEVNINEQKRNIRILDSGYIAAIEKEFRELMRNG